MRKVFLDDLPRWGKGRLEGKIKWKACVLYKVNFEYDGIKGEVEIIDYISERTPKLIIKYKNKTIEISTSHFVKCKIGKLIGKVTNEFKIEINSVFKDENRNFTILDREYRKNIQNPDIKGRVYINNYKWYKYKCEKCSYVGYMREDHILKGIGCSCCCKSPRVAILGINTIWDTDRWLCDIGVSEEDAKTHTKSCMDEILVKCPDCGKKKTNKINIIYNNKSIGCVCNGDGFSYPEKFLGEFLNQLGVSYMTQLTKTTFDWVGNYRYDFYFEYNNEKHIIETHGSQHYKNSFRRSLEEEQLNDKLKEIRAKQNNIDNYIVINCMKSDMEYIKNNILNDCKIIKIFGDEKVKNINWNKCNKVAISNLVYDISAYWNKKYKDETTKDLADVFGITRNTVIRYLKIASKMGVAKYNELEEMRINASKNGKLNTKRIEIFKGNKSLGVFEGCTVLQEISENLFGVKLLASGIYNVAKGRKASYKGFTFKYVE